MRVVGLNSKNGRKCERKCIETVPGIQKAFNIHKIDFKTIIKDTLASNFTFALVQNQGMSKYTVNRKTEKWNSLYIETNSGHTPICCKAGVVFARVLSKHVMYQRVF